MSTAGRAEEEQRFVETVVQFGAGNIGRGFVGQLWADAGYEVVFVDVSPELVERLNRERAYPLRLVGPDRFEERTVRPVRAINGRDVGAVAEELARCAFACTAVGVGALPHLVPALAEGIRRRSGLLDVILCENQLHCSDLLRGLLAKELSDEALQRVGLVESVVSRMVPPVPEAERAAHPLLAVAEDYERLPVDSSAFRGPVPPVSALVPAENFTAYVERKLYMHNMAHAVTAYLGYERGCDYIHQAVAVPEIRETAQGALAETAGALRRKFGFTAEELARHGEDLLRRFANAAMGDTVLRVGRDPIRKLRPDDRLIGAALTCLDWDVEPHHVVRGIVAALRFAPAEDLTAVELQRVVHSEGVGQALYRYTGLQPESELGRRILEAWDRA